jgi:hypothetical protein
LVIDAQYEYNEKSELNCHGNKSSNKMNGNNIDSARCAVRTFGNRKRNIKKAKNLKQTLRTYGDLQRHK